MIKKLILITTTILILQSSIPLQIAPTVEDYKITVGKNFKRSLPKRQMFIFEAPKRRENSIIIYTKFVLRDNNVYDDIPFVINENQYFFSFYETEILDKSFQLLPIVTVVIISNSFGSDEIDPIFSNPDGISRTENYYIALEVHSDKENDCLQENSLSHNVVLDYLRDLKKEYLATHNYNEVLFKD